MLLYLYFQTVLNSTALALGDLLSTLVECMFVRHQFCVNWSVHAKEAL